MKANYTNNGVDIRIEVNNYQLSYGQVDLVDFFVYFERSSGEEYNLYLQVDLDEEHHVCALNGVDNQDDYGLLPKFVDEDELINDMNKELDEYKKR